MICRLWVGRQWGKEPVRCGAGRLFFLKRYNAIPQKMHENNGKQGLFATSKDYGTERGG